VQDSTTMANYTLHELLLSSYDLLVERLLDHQTYYQDQLDIMLQKVNIVLAAASIFSLILLVIIGTRTYYAIKSLRRFTNPGDLLPLDEISYDSRELLNRQYLTVQNVLFATRSWSVDATTDSSECLTNVMRKYNIPVPELNTTRAVKRALMLLRKKIRLKIIPTIYLAITKRQGRVLHVFDSTELEHVKSIAPKLDVNPIIFQVGMLNDLEILCLLARFGAPAGLDFTTTINMKIAAGEKFPRGYCYLALIPISTKASKVGAIKNRMLVSECGPYPRFETLWLKFETLKIKTDQLISLNHGLVDGSLHISNDAFRGSTYEDVSFNMLMRRYGQHRQVGGVPCDYLIGEKDVYMNPAAAFWWPYINTIATWSVLAYIFEHTLWYLIDEEVMLTVFSVFISVPLLYPVYWIYKALTSYTFARICGVVVSTAYVFNLFGGKIYGALIATSKIFPYCGTKRMNHIPDWLGIMYCGWINKSDYKFNMANRELSSHSEYLVPVNNEIPERQYERIRNWAYRGAQAALFGCGQYLFCREVVRKRRDWVVRTAPFVKPIVTPRPETSNLRKRVYERRGISDYLELHTEIGIVIRDDEHLHELYHAAYVLSTVGHASTILAYGIYNEALLVDGVVFQEPEHSTKEGHKTWLHDKVRERHRKGLHTPHLTGDLNTSEYKFDVFYADGNRMSQYDVFFKALAIGAREVYVTHWCTADLYTERCGMFPDCTIKWSKKLIAVSLTSAEDDPTLQIAGYLSRGRQIVQLERHNSSTVEYLDSENLKRWAEHKGHVFGGEGGYQLYGVKASDSVTTRRYVLTEIVDPGGTIRLHNWYQAELVYVAYYEPHSQVGKLFRQRTKVGLAPEFLVRRLFCNQTIVTKAETLSAYDLAMSLMQHWELEQAAGGTVNYLAGSVMGRKFVELMGTMAGLNKIIGNSRDNITNKFTIFTDGFWWALRTAFGVKEGMKATAQGVLDQILIPVKGPIEIKCSITGINNGYELVEGTDDFGEPGVEIHPVLVVEEKEQDYASREVLLKREVLVKPTPTAPTLEQIGAVEGLEPNRIGLNEAITQNRRIRERAAKITEERKNRRASVATIRKGPAPFESAGLWHKVLNALKKEKVREPVFFDGLAMMPSNTGWLMLPIETYTTQQLEKLVVLMLEYAQKNKAELIARGSYWFDAENSAGRYQIVHHNQQVTDWAYDGEPSDRPKLHNQSQFVAAIPLDKIYMNMVIENVGKSNDPPIIEKEVRIVLPPEVTREAKEEAEQKMPVIQHLEETIDQAMDAVIEVEPNGLRKRSLVACFLCCKCSLKRKCCRCKKRNKRVPEREDGIELVDVDELGDRVLVPVKAPEEKGAEDAQLVEKDPERLPIALHEQPKVVERERESKIKLGLMRLRSKLFDRAKNPTGEPQALIKADDVKHDKLAEDVPDEPINRVISERQEMLKSDLGRRGCCWEPFTWTWKTWCVICIQMTVPFTILTSWITSCTAGWNCGRWARCKCCNAYKVIKKREEARRLQKQNVITDRLWGTRYTAAELSAISEKNETQFTYVVSREVEATKQPTPSNPNLLGNPTNDWSLTVRLDEHLKGGVETKFGTRHAVVDGRMENAIFTNGEAAVASFLNSGVTTRPYRHELCEQLYRNQKVIILSYGYACTRSFSNFTGSGQIVLYLVDKTFSRIALAKPSSVAYWLDSGLDLIVGMDLLVFNVFASGHNTKTNGPQAIRAHVLNQNPGEILPTAIHTYCNNNCVAILWENKTYIPNNWRDAMLFIHGQDVWKVDTGISNWIAVLTDNYNIADWATIL